MIPKMPPPGWGMDSLTGFLDRATENRWATFVGKRPMVQKLIAIDGCFERPTGHFSTVDKLLPSLLFIRSHTAFRAACEHAMAGEVVECFGDIRACLENAAYGLHIAKSDDLDEIWLRRHDDDAASTSMRKAFRLTDLKATIRTSNRKAADIFATLYETSIDFGAHPNERALTGSLEIKDIEDGRQFNQVQLHGDGIQLDHALVSTARAGTCALEIFQGVFGARFELLGVNADILEIRKGL